MIELKQLNYEYALQIDEIWKKHWDMYTVPDSTSKIIDTVAVQGDRVIAYGHVKHFAEMMYFPDMDAPLRARMEAIKLVVAEGFRGVDKAHLREVYCLMKDMRFARLFCKHFGFTMHENPGILLHKDMRG